MSSSQDVSRKGRKKALLIAVRKVKEIDVPLPRTHYDIRELKELLINQYGYAENDIVMLLDDGKLDRPFWSSDVNIVNNIKWLVEDLREDDRLVFYYSGHGGQTICRHDSEVDGRDEVIYGFNGRKIVDNTLKRELVDPVLKTKGCHLFTLFDCCHSETILDLKHCNCYSRLQPPVKSSTTSSQTGGTDVTLPLPNKWLWFSNGYPVALPISMSSQNKNVLFMSPWSVIGLANRVLGHQSDSGISYRGLLDDIQSQVIDLQARKAQGRPFDRFQARRQFELTSESDSSLVRRKGSTQEPRISSNCPFDWNKKVYI
ncbi:hypothetical protein M405DRAFT_883348 [Rhizopogon salebrosus TDB-379]|nr:hypothetical protein M405DRAFT_883348 [Rhizopogon salebrosus TDB-379]